MDDSHGIRKSEFPGVGTMPPGIDEGINAKTKLRTVGDRTTPFGELFVDGAERTSEKRERNFVRTKRTDE